MVLAGTWRRLDKIGERPRCASCQSRWQRFIEGSGSSGSQQQLAARRVAAPCTFLAAHAYWNIALQQKFVRVPLGHGPGKRDLVAGAGSGQIRNRIRQLERRRQRRTRCPATGKAQSGSQHNRQGSPSQSMLRSHCPYQSTGSGKKLCPKKAVKLFRRYRALRTPSQASAGGQDHIGGIQMFRDAEAKGMFLLRIP